MSEWKNLDLVFCLLGIEGGVRLNLATSLFIGEFKK